MASAKKDKSKLFLFINYIPKRIRIVVSVFIMTILVLLSTLIDLSAAWWFFIPLLMVCSYALTYLSVFEGVEKIEWFTLFIMPVLFTVVFYLFFTLLPARWLTRLPYIVFYAFAFYAILLTSNIFNVGVEKSLQLYRAAFSVNFLFQTLIVFLIAQVMLTFKQNFIVNAFSLMIGTFPLAMQLFWTLNPVHELKRELRDMGLLVSILIFELTTLISFVPLKASIAALATTACYYSLTGILYHYLDQRLFKNVLREYTFVVIFVIIIVLLTLQW